MRADINNIKTDREVLEYHKRYFRGKNKEDNIKKVKRSELCRLYSILYNGIKVKSSYKKDNIVRAFEDALVFEERTSSMKL